MLQFYTLWNKADMPWHMFDIPCATKVDPDRPADTGHTWDINSHIHGTKV
jgi:hypothetical protein